MSSNAKWFIGIGVGIVFLFIFFAIFGSGGDPNFDYCFDRMYSQGFRGDDLNTLVEACLRNPGR